MDLKLVDVIAGNDGIFPERQYNSLSYNRYGKCFRIWLRQWRESSACWTKNSTIS